MSEGARPASPLLGDDPYEDFDDDPYEDFDDVSPSKVPGVGHPLKTIWKRPRTTLRWILKTDPTYLVTPLACAWGFNQALNRMAAKHLGDVWSTPALLGIAIVAGPLGGLFVLYVFGWIFSWSGRALGGKGNPQDVRAAIAWGQSPALAMLAVHAVQIAAVGHEQFTRATPKLQASPGLQAFYAATMGVDLVLLWWMVALVLRCVGEAHRFSAWRALGAILLGAFAYLVPLLVVMLVLARLAAVV